MSLLPVMACGPGAGWDCFALFGVGRVARMALIWCLKSWIPALRGMRHGVIGKLRGRNLN